MEFSTGVAHAEFTSQASTKRKVPSALVPKALSAQRPLENHPEALLWRYCTYRRKDDVQPICQAAGLARQQVQGTVAYSNLAVLGFDNMLHASVKLSEVEQHDREPLGWRPRANTRVLM